MIPVQSFGREMIYSPVTSVTKDNAIAVLNAALQIHEINVTSIDYLYKYYRGKQPILERTKTVRSEINNRVVENHALEIVDFKKGYVFGEPIQYVRRGDNTALTEKVSNLNSLMMDANKADHDSALAEWFNICGTAYRMVLPGDPIEIDTLDPRSTFVVYHSGFGHRPLMGVTYTKDADDKIRYSVYTDDFYFEIRDDQIIEEVSKAHILKSIPIIEYPVNRSRLGSFEVVLGLLNALNNSASNRMDGIEQFIQSFIKFVNCEIDTTTFKELKEMGAIKVKSDPGNPADVDIISQELDQSQVQIFIDHTYQMVLIICGMPDRNGSNRTTGDTGQAVILRDGWTAAESRARDTETIFKVSEKRFLNLVLSILKDANQDTGLKLADIDIKFTRNKTDSLLVKSQGLQNLLEAGINPATAIKTVGLFSDPEQVVLDSEKYLQKWDPASPANISQKVNPANNKPNPVEGAGENG